jgi:hypothetical protein
VPRASVGVVSNESSPNDSADDGDADALMSRLRLIEDQQLGSRAEAYAQVFEELRAQLEGGDLPSEHG